MCGLKCSLTLGFEEKSNQPFLEVTIKATFTRIVKLFVEYCVFHGNSYTGFARGRSGVA